MAIPYRGKTEAATYFVTANTFEKQQLLQSDRMATLFIDVLHHYREQKKYLLHEYVVMPDHFHLLITPSSETLERAMQLIKGGFSHQVRKELGFSGDLWQTSYVDRRVRDYREYRQFKEYIQRNPVKRLLVSTAEYFPYSSAANRSTLDAVPQRLNRVLKKRGAFSQAAVVSS